MSKPTPRILVLFLFVITLVGIYTLSKELKKLNPPVRPEDRISTNTFELLSNIKNDDVIWNGGGI